MILKRILFSFFIFSVGALKAQTNTNEHLYCGQPHALQKMQTNDPQRYAEYQQQQVLNASSSNENALRSGVVYTIPVVFHVLHNQGAENISQAQIDNALFILNRDFRKQNNDVNDVVNQFLPITGDAEIEFKYAKIAPNGVCFNGITRTQSNLTYDGSDGENQINAIINGNDVYNGIWPHNKYLNIYVCEDIGGAAGYTYLPNGNSQANASNMFYNGIFVLQEYVGAIGTGNLTRSRTLTHEVGHWMNLKHTWGDGNSPGNVTNCDMDDDVTDTPNTVGATSCDLTQNTCGVLANVENYMDYSYCSKMFTNGQVTRMRNALLSNTGGRSNIWTTANLTATGVLEGSSICSAAINATQTSLCQGTSTAFSITNFTPTISSYSWTFAGGTPATSTAANPTVTYNSAGNHQVSVTIVSGGQTRTITNANYITVNATPTIVNLPIQEGFVAATFPPTNWSLTNTGNQNAIWRRSNSGNNGANGATYMDNYSINFAGQTDDLNAPVFSLSGVESSTLTFDVAHAVYQTSNDKLEVLVSAGCAENYQVVYSKSGTTLATQTSTNQLSNPSTWRSETVDLTPFIGNEIIRVKFRNTSDYGNNVFLDNINITASGTTPAVMPAANFTASVNQLCVGSTVTYTSTSTDATSFSWNFGANANPATAVGAGPHTVTYTSAGTKNVTLTATNANGSDDAMNSVTVNALPTVIFPTLSALCDYSTTISLNTATPTGGSYTGTGVTNNQFSAVTAGIGNHTITYTYTNSNGCTNTATSSIEISACVGIADVDESSFAVYPNPTTSNLYIDAEKIESVTILDIHGKQVKYFPTSQISYDLSNLSNGPYFVRIVTSTGSNTVKILVE